MNNEEFRRLVGASGIDASPQDGSPAGPTSTSNGVSLGSRQRASIPMTPRSVGGAQANFARQLAERNQANRPDKKFKTSAPKGVKYGSAYVDRSKAREEQATDEREEKLKALEKSLKEEEIDRETYERLRFEIAGGDVTSTHLVKGLDFKLLERVRKGEDVYGEKKAEPESEEQRQEEEEDGETEVDVDAEFDKLENQDVQAVAKTQQEKKKGQLADVSLAPGKKRTRDQILAEFKAAREAAKAAKQSGLGDGFKKIGAKQMPGTRIERDRKGREVMIIVDEDGHEKRKVRKVQAQDEGKEALPMPDATAKPLGMEVPEQYRDKVEEPPEEEDDDIFADVGDDYDPLAGLDGSSDSDSDGEDAEKKEEKEEVSETKSDMPPPSKPKTGSYFGKGTLLSEQAGPSAPSMSDPAIKAAFERAAKLNAANREPEEDSDEEDEERAKNGRMSEKELQERRNKLMQAMDRDDADMDMGFGTSRFEDEQDGDDNERVKLSRWGQNNDDDDGEGKGGKGKRKRGPKKRKGDANSAADVLRVMEERKKE